MNDGPRVVLQQDTWRIVEWADGTKHLERRDGEDAMGVERWHKMEIGSADVKFQKLRDYLFKHVTECPLLRGVDDEH